MTEPIRIIALPGGPLLVEGACVVTDEAGQPYPPRVGKKPGVYLCRCGHSAEKPWCDGSHRRIGFTASPAPPAESAPGKDPKPDPLESAGGTGLVGSG